MFNSLTHLTINAQSLQYKMNELREIAFQHKPQVIAVTESWGRPDIDDITFKIDGYIMYRSDKINRASSDAGGTLLYVTDKLGQRECKPLKTPENGIPFDSSTWCWVTPTKGKKVLVGCIYRSPSSLIMNNDKLLKLMDQANEIAGNSRLLILGDFNIPNIDWINITSMPTAKKIEKDLLGKITDNLMYQHVKENTRIRGNQKSILDLILTKEEDDVKNVKVLPPIGRSDHGIVKGEFICKWKSRIIPRKIKAYRKGKYDNMINALNQTVWREEYADKSGSECIRHLMENYVKLEGEAVPEIMPRDYNEPWMNTRLMKLWKKKNCSWSRLQELNSNNRWKRYRRDRDKLRTHIRKAKRVYEGKIAKNARTNMKAFFRYVNSRLTVRPEITALRTSDNKIVEEDKDIVEVQVDYFSTVYTSYKGEQMPEMQEMTEAKLDDIQITPEMVEAKLKKLNENKSSGSDVFHPYVLKETAQEMSLPLSLIYQKLLNEGVCPDEWKCANVTPIHKKGDRTDPGNYRPVSLTSQVCKVLESIIVDKISEHLTSNELLNEAQHGFREGRSCLTNLLETLEQWTEIIDEGDAVDVAYLDFRKAFDLVSHEHLIYKLSKYGIKGKILNWIKDFLNGRTQRVVIRGTASSPREVTSGVPQGSVLGPILFLIFINDLPLGILSALSLFADDSKLFSRIVRSDGKLESDNEDRNQTLQGDLNAVLEWAKKWKMEFNVNKCKIMHLGYNNPKISYSMGGSNLEETEEEKDLGVLIDNKLDFGNHIKCIVGKANRVLGMIRVSFTCLNVPMLFNLYTALVRPLLEYCVQVWSPYKKKYINLLEGVQRRATRMIPRLKKMTYDERLKKLKLPRLYDRRIRGDMIETYKIMSGKEKLNSRNLFQPSRFIGRSHPMKLHKKYSRLNMRKNWFTQRVINKWNSLTIEEVESNKTSSFKRRYDKKEAERRLVVEKDIYVWG